MSDISDSDDYFNYCDRRQLDILNSEMDDMKYHVSILTKNNKHSNYVNCFGLGFSLSLGVCTSIALLCLVLRKT